MARITTLLINSARWLRKVNTMNPLARIIGLGDRIQRQDEYGRPRRTVTNKTEDATLTAAEVRYGLINATDPTVAIALTLPDAATALAGCDVIIGMGGAAVVTVIVTAGFGGGGADADTVTLAQGDSCHCVCDGTAWFVTNVTTAA